jgi:hypothetical protein
MRNLLGILAACLFGLAAPASAQMVQLSISGTLQGTKSTIVCGPASPPECLTTYGGATTSQSYEQAFLQSLFVPVLLQGDNAFSFGFSFGGGEWSGIIHNDNGVLTGRNLSFLLVDNGVRFGTVGSNTINAQARSFAITAVPEPATWALMLLGFLAIGSALRQAPRRALLPA